MKILISAIACSPSAGSEASVGWSAVKLVARRHDVFVLTSAGNRLDWERASARGRVPDNVKVRYLGTDAAWHPNRLIARLDSWLRFIRFNRSLLQAALEWHEEEKFDLAHHLTYATWRVPSPLWRLPIPFVWGPIAGAARYPCSFLGELSPQARLFERLRSVTTFVARRSKGFRDAIENAAVVIAANEETREFLGPFRRDRPLRVLPVAFLSADAVKRFRPRGETGIEGPLRLFAGGNMIGSKGLALAVRALKLASEAGIDFHYTIAGGGPEIPRIQALVRELGLETKICFHPGYQGDAYVRALQETEIYFLPSFREAFGLTMVEAVLCGCYPVVADTSMPGEIVTKSGGSAVATIDADTLVTGLCEAIVKAASRRSDLRSEALAIRQRVLDLFSAEKYEAEVEAAYATATR